MNETVTPTATIDRLVSSDIPLLFGKAGLVALIFCLGFIAVVYIPAVIQLLFMKIGLFLTYYPPEYFYEQYLLKLSNSLKAAGHHHSDDDDHNDDDDDHRDEDEEAAIHIPTFRKSLLEDPTRKEDIKNFFGYYDQEFFTKYPRGSLKNYCCNNVIVLVTVAIQIALLMCTVVIFCVAFDFSFTDLTASALFPTVFAIFHFSEFIKGYFAYIWFVWSNTLRLGHEIDIDNLRGDLVELGPVTSYIYVYMRGVPMIGSVDSKVNPDPPAPTPQPVVSSSPPPNSPPLTPAKQAILPNTMSLQQFVRNRNATIINVDTLNHNSAIRKQMPMITGSITKPLRVFNFEDSGFKVPRIPDSVNMISDHPESLNFNRPQMYQVGYVMLPLDQHFRYQVNTASLLSSNFRNYSYNSVHIPKAIANSKRK